MDGNDRRGSGTAVAGALLAVGLLLASQRDARAQPAGSCASTTCACEPGVARACNFDCRAYCCSRYPGSYGAQCGGGPAASPAPAQGAAVIASEGAALGSALSNLGDTLSQPGPAHFDTGPLVEQVDNPPHSAAVRDIAAIAASLPKDQLLSRLPRADAALKAYTVDPCVFVDDAGATFAHDRIASLARTSTRIGARLDQLAKPLPGVDPGGLERATLDGLWRDVLADVLRAVPFDQAQSGVAEAVEGLASLLTMSDPATPDQDIDVLAKAEGARTKALSVLADALKTQAQGSYTRLSWLSSALDLAKTFGDLAMEDARARHDGKPRPSHSWLAAIWRLAPAAFDALSFFIDGDRPAPRAVARFASQKQLESAIALGKAALTGGESATTLLTMRSHAIDDLVGTLKSAGSCRDSHSPHPQPVPIAPEQPKAPATCAPSTTAGQPPSNICFTSVEECTKAIAGAAASFAREGAGGSAGICASHPEWQVPAPARWPPDDVRLGYPSTLLDAFARQDRAQSAADSIAAGRAIIDLAKGIHPLPLPVAVLRDIEAGYAIVQRADFNGPAGITPGGSSLGNAAQWFAWAANTAPWNPDGHYAAAITAERWMGALQAQGISVVNPEGALDTALVHYTLFAASAAPDDPRRTAAAAELERLQAIHDGLAQPEKTLRETSRSWPYGRPAYVISIGMGGAYPFGSNNQLQAVGSKVYPAGALVGSGDIAIRATRWLMLGGFGGVSAALGGGDPNQSLVEIFVGGQAKVTFAGSASSDHSSFFEPYVQLGLGALFVKGHLDVPSVNSDLSASAPLGLVGIGFDYMGSHMIGFGLYSGVRIAGVGSFQTSNGSTATDASGNKIQASFDEWDVLLVRLLLGG